uniref:Putative ecdysteroid kinase n=2 Tax=Panstrongylus TaxID=65342 RepID=A0A069DTX9_9HEMI
MSDSSDEEEWPVSAEWLSHVLSEYHGGSAVLVTDYRLSQAESALSDILSLKVTYERPPGQQQTTISLVLKLLPRDPFSRFFVTEAQFDLREIKFYTKVAPDLHEFQKDYLQDGQQPIHLPIPKCYHARYSGGDESPVESVLVLENLKSSGYDVMEFSRGLTLDQTRSALAAVAKLHALSLVMKVKEGRPLDKKYPFLFQTARATDSYQQLVERGLPQLAQFLETRHGLTSVMEALARLKSDTKELISSLLAPSEPIALITHTDFWCNNLLFRDDNSCRVLDWQMVTYSKPTNDVALLLVSSVPTELRRRHCSILLDHYWKNFTENSLKLGLDIQNELGYNRQDLERDFKRSQLLALLLCIGSVDVALGDPITEQRLLDLLQDLHDDGILTKDLI